MRVAFSAVLVAFVIFLVQYRKSLPPASTSNSTPTAAKPFPSPEGGQGFAWIPAYPGAEIENIRTKLTHGEQSYGYRFHTPDEFKKVDDFYADQLKAAGFTVIEKQHPDGVDLHAEYPDRTRLLDVSTLKTPPGTEVGITATQR